MRTPRTTVEHCGPALKFRWIMHPALPVSANLSSSPRISFLPKLGEEENEDSFGRDMSFLLPKLGEEEKDDSSAFGDISPIHGSGDQDPGMTSLRLTLESERGHTWILVLQESDSCSIKSKDSRVNAGEDAVMGGEGTHRVVQCTSCHGVVQEPRVRNTTQTINPPVIHEDHHADNLSLHDDDDHDIMLLAIGIADQRQDEADQQHYEKMALVLQRDADERSEERLENLRKGGLENLPRAFDPPGSPKTVCSMPASPSDASMLASPGAPPAPLHSEKLLGAIAGAADEEVRFFEEVVSRTCRG